VTEENGFLVLAIVHGERALFQAARIATDRDAGANRRGFSLLRADAYPGATMQFFMESQLLAIAEPWQEAEWRGEPLQVVFQVRVPADRIRPTIEATLHVGIDGIPVGEITFDVHLSPQEHAVAQFAALQEAAPAATAAHRFEQAFISYSRKDFGVVSFFAQGLAENGIACLDVSALEPGDDWGSELARHLDEA
jgi:hypothetical protein